jgi:hypothetical protein
MRQSLSLSLSTDDARQIKNLSKKRGSASLSAYVKFLADTDSELIYESELLKSARLARREYRAGKAIKALSIAELY